MLDCHSEQKPRNPRISPLASDPERSQIDPRTLVPHLAPVQSTPDVLSASLHLALLSLTLPALAQTPSPPPTAPKPFAQAPILPSRSDLFDHEGHGHSEVVFIPAKIASRHLLHKAPAFLPANAKNLRLWEYVLLAIDIDPKGMVQGISAMRGPEPLRASAITAAKQYRYRPFLLHGKARSVKTQLKVIFPLDVVERSPSTP